MPEFIRLAFAVLFPLGVVAAGLKDATSYIIPNRLNAAIALAFVPAALCAGLSGPMFAVCGLAGFVALALGVVLFCLRLIGGGDAKLLAACVLWLGPAAAAPFLAWTALAGGLLALGLLAARRTPGLAVISGAAWVQRLLQPKGEAPYGVAIAVGALIAFPASPIAHALHGL
jgi:prepilin peptidase CpaA